MENLKYLNAAFYADNLEDAKNIVLTPDHTNPKYFIQETQYFINVLDTLKLIADESIVVDYGCGMGRLTKPIIEKFNCRVIGIDQSLSMLSHARHYVNSQLFEACQQSHCTTADLVISVFVLQHSADPDRDIDKFYNLLKPNGTVVLVNEHQRYVPVALDPNNYVIWHDDQIDILQIMKKRFKFIAKHRYYNGNDILTIWKKI